MTYRKKFLSRVYTALCELPFSSSNLTPFLCNLSAPFYRASCISQTHHACAHCDVWGHTDLRAIPSSAPCLSPTALLTDFSLLEPQCKHPLSKAFPAWCPVSWRFPPRCLPFEYKQVECYWVLQLYTCIFPDSFLSIHYKLYMGKNEAYFISALYDIVIKWTEGCQSPEQSSWPLKRSNKVVIG